MFTNVDHATLGSVTLNRSARAKRISISVLASGEVRLTIPYNGDKTTALSFLDSRIDWIIKAREKVAKRASERAQSTPKSLERDELELLKAKAMEYLPRRVEELARAFGFRYGRITIRFARTKWGSCSGINNLSLNMLMMQLPNHLIDFIILHELCHTIHHNHSAQFYQLLNRCTDGHERELHRALKQFRI